LETPSGGRNVATVKYFWRGTISTSVPSSNCQFDKSVT